MIRVRHYTRVSSMRKILAEGVLRAKDQNRVFVERANDRRLSPTDARSKYGLGKGKGAAYVEFDLESERLQWRNNPQTRCIEGFVLGDVDLS